MVIGPEGPMSMQWNHSVCVDLTVGCSEKKVLQSTRDLPELESNIKLFVDDVCNRFESPIFVVLACVDSLEVSFEAVF